MKKTLLFQARHLLLALAVPFLVASCDSESTEPTPVAGPTTTDFAMVDSLKVDAYFQSSNPEAYQKYQGKTYQVQSQNKVETFFHQENQDLILYFKEVSQEKEQPWVTLTLKNRIVQNLPPSMSLKDEALVCVQQGQTFKDGTAALSPGCVTVLAGTVSLQYDPATKVLNGSVTGLKFGLEYYVPDYAFPNRDGNILRASGSSRNLSISFTNVKEK